VSIFDNRHGRAAGQVAFVLTLAVACSARAADPFEELNAAFRQQHAAAREREWAARSGPVILVDFDKLTLFMGNDRRTADVIPLDYHRLKSVAHAPFAIYLVLEGVGDGPLGEQQRERLKDLASRMETVRKALNTAGLAPDVTERQRAILDRCETFVTGTLKAGATSPHALRTFAADVMPQVAKNIDESAAMQIRAYDGQVAGWQREFPDLNWRMLKVVITGSALPRKDNLATQYFMRLLGVSGEGERLVYAESLYDETKALRLLNATAVDVKAASIFFDDRDRLRRDLLADAAARFLREHATDLKAKPVVLRP
jgi:hypothetical protein